MQKRINPRWIGAWCAVTLISVAANATAQKMVHAKIGVQVVAGDDIRQARSKDKLDHGDKLRIFIEPQAESYIYVVHADRNATALLAGPKKQNGMMVLPSENEFYEINGDSPFEKLTIFCSTMPLDTIEALFSNRAPAPSEWAKVETALVEKSQLDLHESTDKPFGIAGNVRTLDDEPTFSIAQLTQYSGKNMVIKRYEFRVKK